MSIMDAFAVQNMWTSVLVQVARDLTRVQSSEAAMAERWIGTYPTRDFREVCARAGLEPSASHAWFRRICDTSFEERKTRMHGLDITVSDAAARPLDFSTSRACDALPVRWRMRYPVSPAGHMMPCRPNGRIAGRMTDIKDSVVNTWMEQMNYAFAQNTECDGGIFARSGCVSIPDGPYGHPAVLAFIDADPDIPVSYRYGIICWLNEPPTGYMAMLLRVRFCPSHKEKRETPQHQNLTPALPVQATSVTNAADAQTMLEEYISVVLSRKDFAWHIVQDIADGEAECVIFEDALRAFQHIIRRDRRGEIKAHRCRDTIQILEFFGLLERSPTNPIAQMRADTVKPAQPVNQTRSNHREEARAPYSSHFLQRLARFFGFSGCMNTARAGSVLGILMGYRRRQRILKNSGSYAAILRSTFKPVANTIAQQIMPVRLMPKPATSRVRLDTASTATGMRSQPKSRSGWVRIGWMRGISVLHEVVGFLRQSSRRSCPCKAATEPQGAILKHFQLILGHLWLSQVYQPPATVCVSAFYDDLIKSGNAL